ncbi:MAG: ABC transporter ATP-binding protein [Chitinispirillaceae bacterium]
MDEKRSVAIKVKDLAKRFGRHEAVRGADFSVLEGEIFGFLGPNGAGKTTTINMITGLARPDKGQILYFGHDYTKDLKKAQHLMGIVPDESNLYPELTGFENLCFCASLYGISKKERQKRSLALLESFGLAQAAHRRFGGYSRGMKRRLTIAAGVIHQPRILFLDEPTSGIDIANGRNIRKLISGLKATGTTVFLTTHYIEEAQRLCDRIAFIVDGQIVRTEATSVLLRDVEGQHIIELAVAEKLRSLPEGITEEFGNLSFDMPSSNTLRTVSESAFPLGPLVRFLEERNISITEARSVRPSLEDVFVRITGIESSTMNTEKEGKNQQ